MFGIDTHYKIQQCYYEGQQRAVWLVDNFRTSSCFKFYSRLCSIRSTIIFQEKLDWTPSSHFCMFCRTFRCFYICVYIYAHVYYKGHRILVDTHPCSKGAVIFSKQSVDKSYFEACLCYKRDPPQMVSTVSYQSLKCCSSRGENIMENDS